MSSGDWIQAATLVSVAVALLLNVRQNREGARQTQELTRQNTAILRSMQQSAYQAMITHPTGVRVSFLKDDPVLLEWHLTTRGFPSATYAENIRRLFIIAKLESYEMCFLNHADGLLTDDVWTGWLNVVRVDAGDLDFQETWTRMGGFYAPSFGGFVEELIAEAGRPGDLRQVA